jgi:hypothetical protein
MYFCFKESSYLCPEYSCEISVEIVLYFELGEKNKFVATYKSKYLSEISLFV